MDETQVAADDRIIDQLFDRFQKVGRPVDQLEMIPRPGPQKGAEGRRGSRNQPIVFPLEQPDEVVRRPEQIEGHESQLVQPGDGKIRDTLRICDPFLLEPAAMTPCQVEETVKIDEPGRVDDVQQAPLAWMPTEGKLAGTDREISASFEQEKSATEVGQRTRVG